MTHKRRTTQQLVFFSPMQKGIVALLKRDYPGALKAFTVAYQDPDWRNRDTALIGLGDMLDARIIEHNKPLSSTQILEWEPPFSIRKPRLSKARMLVLLDTYLQPVLWKPENLLEQRTLRAMYETKQMLERILLNDASYLVRFSALLILVETLGPTNLHFIHPTLRRGISKEKHPALKSALSGYLNDQR